MKVFLNHSNFKHSKERIIVDVELVRKLESWFLCKLPDGNIIKRSIKRDLPEGEKL